MKRSNYVKIVAHLKSTFLSIILWNKHTQKGSGVLSIGFAPQVILHLTKMEGYLK